MAIEIEFFSLVSETIFSLLVLRLSFPLKIVSLHQWTLFKVVNESEFLKKLVHYPILDYLVEFLNYNYLNIPQWKKSQYFIFVLSSAICTNIPAHFLIDFKQIENRRILNIIINLICWVLFQYFKNDFFPLRQYSFHLVNITVLVKVF